MAKYSLEKRGPSQSPWKAYSGQTTRKKGSQIQRNETWVDEAPRKVLTVKRNLGESDRSGPKGSEDV